MRSGMTFGPIDVKHYRGKHVKSAGGEGSGPNSVVLAFPKELVSRTSSASCRMFCSDLAISCQARDTSSCPACEGGVAVKAPSADRCYAGIKIATDVRPRGNVA